MVKNKIFYSCFWLLLAVLSACSQEELLPGTDSQFTDSDTPPLQTLRMSASMEQHGGDTRTILQGNRVFWEAGDEFEVSNNFEPALRVELTASGQALGISANKSDVPIVRYSSVQVLVSGQDVTAEITAVGLGQSNAYQIGMLNSNDRYELAPAGTDIAAKLVSYKGGFMNLSTYYAVPLIQSGGTSNAVVILKGLEVSLDNGNSWTEITSGTTLLNGSAWSKSDVAYSWMQRPLPLSFTLQGDGGQTRADFISETNSSLPDETAIAIYPKGVLTEYKQGILTLDVPQKQTYVENSFDHAANIAMGHVIAQNGVYSAQFRNMGGVFQLWLTGDAHASVKRIKLTDKSGKMLWGMASVPVAELEQGIRCCQLSGGTNSIILECPDVELSETPQVFHFVVPVGAFENGFEVTVEESGELQDLLRTEKNNMVVRNVIRQMPPARAELLYTLNLENDAVVKYMSYGNYSRFGATSYFTTYSSTLKKYVDYDSPQTFEAQWEGSENETYSLTMTDDTEGRDVFADRLVTGTTYRLQNMIPEHKYTYTVKAGGQQIQKSSFRTSGQIRMVNIADSWNYRDLGGWTGMQNHKVRYNWIYRGGSLNGVWQKGTSKYAKAELANANNYIFSDRGRQDLTDLGILAELDLRAKLSEFSSSTDYSHSISLDQPMTGLNSWDFIRIKSDGAQTSPLTDYAVVQDVAWIIDQVLNKHHPVAFHCKSGADRTGCVAMIILALLGVDQGNIARDYELTNFSHEQGVVTGTHELRDRKASSISSSYKFYTNGFMTLGKADWQEDAYYYLNQYFANQGVAISADLLDEFICFMLGMDSYTHPSWATTNDLSLETIFMKGR